MAERDRSPHHGNERGAADQHHVGKKEEVEAEGHEEESLALQRQALPHEVQPAGSIESPLEYGTSLGGRGVIEGGG